MPQSSAMLAPERLRAEIDQFYARHMQLLDAGRAEEWAATFTEDGTFYAPTAPEPVQGRAALAEAVGRSAAALAEAHQVHRHWHGMLNIEPQQDGTVHVTCYALVIATVRGGESRIHRACVCRDVLVRADGSWQVRRRHVTRDDLP